MSESNKEPDIYLKDFKLDAKETKITIENGKVCISGTSPSITAQEIKIRVEDGKLCIMGSPTNIKNEFDKMGRVTTRQMMFSAGSSVGIAVMIVGATKEGYWIWGPAGAFIILISFIAALLYGRARVKV